MAENHAITPTKNPIPSRELRDALFNAELFDILLGSDAYEVSSRLGKSLTTHAGFTKSFADLRYGIVEDFDDLYEIKKERLEALYEKTVNDFDGPLKSAQQAASESQKSAQDASDSAGSADASSIQARNAANASRVASESSGPVRYFDSYEEASGANFEEGQVIEIFADEQKYGRNTRYRFESGALVYKPRGPLYSDTPGIFHSNIITEDPLWPANSNGLLIGPVVTIGDGVTVNIPDGTVVTISEGTEIKTNV